MVWDTAEATGRVAFEMTQNEPRDMAWALPWDVCLSNDVAGHSPPRGERTQQNSEGRWELIRMAPSLFWS